jgi:prevent-host-death family protein
MGKATTTRANVWKLEDAKARFSELVRKARTGSPQTVTVHGKAAVVVVDSARFEIRAKSRGARPTVGFIAAAATYRGGAKRIDFTRAPLRGRDTPPDFFEGEFFDEEDAD